MNTSINLRGHGFKKGDLIVADGKPVKIKKVINAVSFSTRPLYFYERIWFGLRERVKRLWKHRLMS